MLNSSLRKVRDLPINLNVFEKRHSHSVFNPRKGVRRFMIRDLAIGLLLLFVTPVFAFDEPTDFRGLGWGITREAAEATIRDQWEKRRQAGEIVIFANIKKEFQSERVWILFYEEYIGGVKNLILLSFLDDKLASVSLGFPSERFSDMVAAFKNRYGNPTKTGSKDFRTPVGARITGQDLVWEGEKTMINLSQYSSSLKDSSAYISTIEYMKYIRDQKRADDTKRAKDL